MSAPRTLRNLGSAAVRFVTSVTVAVWVSGFAGAAPPEGAHAVGAHEGDDPRIEARLLVHPDRPGDGSRRLGVLFELDAGWHLYWRNPGQTGLPTELAWEVDGARVGPVAWPAPKSFREAEGLFTTYGYSERVLLAVDAVPEGAAEALRRTRVRADVLVCRESCIPATLRLERQLDAGVAGEDPEVIRRTFSEFGERVPLRPEAAGLELAVSYSQSAIRPDDAFGAAIELRMQSSALRAQSVALSAQSVALRAQSAEFFPDRLDGIEIEPARQRLRPSGGGALLTLSGRATTDPGGDQRLSGVLSLYGTGGPTHVEVDLPLPRAPQGAAITLAGASWPLVASERAAPAQTGLLEALLLALLGGMVLNLMPCVLPVLAIKVVSVTELSTRSRLEVLAHGVAYTAGILVTMLALAAAVVALRAAGTSVGWGFQFQEPLFVAAICTVLVVFALNLFGVFEIAIHAGRLAMLGHEATGPRRSFFEGLLAVVLATPCSAPFLGTAVGFAFASFPWVIALIFLAIGAGLAAPFVAVTLFPASARLLPRPGAWMLKLRAGLGFALLATVVWLLWVLGRSIGVDALTSVLAFLVAVAFATWIYGSVAPLRHPRLKPGVGIAVLLAGFLGFGAVGFETNPSEAPAASRGESSSSAFDPAAIEEELRAGRPVFVYFTADWCITCAANERLVLSNRDVQAALQRYDVALFKADWTRRDERIRTELARFGKAGVPMYLVYGPDTPQSPVLLPELLTVELVLEALAEAAASRPGTPS